LQIEPSIIVDIEFQRPKHGRDIGTPSATDRQCQLKMRTFLHHQAMPCRKVLLSGLKKVIPIAQGCHFSSVAPLVLSNTKWSPHIQRCQLPKTKISEMGNVMV